MEGKYEKELKKIIKAEVAPLLIGLRNEMKGVAKLLKKQNEKKAPTEFDVKVKDFPEIQRVETVNPQKEVSIKNFPEAVRVKGIKWMARGLTKFYEDKERSIGKALLKYYIDGVKQLKSHVFKVEISNQKEIEFPETQEVDFVDGIYEVLKGLKQAEVQRVKIENSTPGEAIPVVLTTKDRKKFYEILNVISSAGRDIATARQNPRPGLRVSEFLESGGSSAVNVDGSVTPITFSASPPTGKKWFIHSISLVIEDAGINFTKFGGIAGGLTNGIEFRVKEAGLAERTLGIFKTNGDFHILTSNIRIDSAGTDFLTIEANTKEITGTTFELANAKSEIFKGIVNDNLIPLNRFNILIRGFEVDE